VDGRHAYCPRDTILTIGKQAIETPWHAPSPRRGRVLRHLVQTVRAPRPRLLDSIYDNSRLAHAGNDEPVFDPPTA
jgi:hypothetical protein